MGVPTIASECPPFRIGLSHRCSRVSPTRFPLDGWEQPGVGGREEPRQPRFYLPPECVCNLHMPCPRPCWTYDGPSRNALAPPSCIHGVGGPFFFFFRFRMPPFDRNGSVPRAIIFEVFAHAPRVSRRASFPNAPFLRVPFAFARLLRPRRSSRGPAWRVSDVGRPWHVCVGSVS